MEAARAQASDLVKRLEQVDDDTSDEELTALAASMDDLATALQQSVMLDPKVIVQPFESETENVVSNSITPTDYFTPSSIALLLQHLALTFAALSIVRDRRTGLFELMRVGPLSSIEIILGKTFAYLLVGCVVAAALLGASALALGVPLAGSIGWLAAITVGVLLSSLALGMIFAILSKTESQAVQYAMLALLAGLFFSGFILPIDGLSYPIKAISWLLARDLRNRRPAGHHAPRRTTPVTLLAGLGALVLGYGLLAVIGLRRRLRTSSDERDLTSGADAAGAFAVAGVLVAIVGTVVIWVFLGDLEDTTDRSLLIGEQATVTLNETIDVAEQVLNAVDDGLTTVQSTLATIDDVLQSTAGLADATGSLSATLPASFDNIDAALATVQRLGETVDSTLSALSSLPFGPDYNPDVPFPEAVGDLRAALEPIGEQLTTISTELQDFATGSGDLTAQIDSLTSDVERTRTALSGTDELLAQYRQATTEAGQLAAETATTCPVR